MFHVNIHSKLKMSYFFLKKNKTRTSRVGAISKAQKAQFSKHAQHVFMKRHPKRAFMLDKTRKPLFPQLGTKKLEGEPF